MALNTLHEPGRPDMIVSNPSSVYPEIITQEAKANGHPLEELIPVGAEVIKAALQQHELTVQSDPTAPHRVSDPNLF